MPSSPLNAQLHSSNCTELLFVDAAAQKPETIQAMLRPGVELIRLGVGRPALTQIATALRDRPAVDTVHILAHGEPGVLQFAAGSMLQWIQISVPSFWCSTSGLATTHPESADRPGPSEETPPR